MGHKLFEMTSKIQLCRPLCHVLCRPLCHVFGIPFGWHFGGAFGRCFGSPRGSTLEPLAVTYLAALGGVLWSPSPASQPARNSMAIGETILHSHEGCPNERRQNKAPVLQKAKTTELPEKNSLRTSHASPHARNRPKNTRMTLVMQGLQASPGKLKQKQHKKQKKNEKRKKKGVP